jgi:hypothetical protein
VDRRVLRELSGGAAESGVVLVGYGALAGGLLHARWLGQPEPAPSQLPRSSQRAAKRAVDAWGDWPAFQGLLVRPVARMQGRSRAGAKDSHTPSQTLPAPRKFSVAAGAPGRPRCKSRVAVTLRVAVLHPADARHSALGGVPGWRRGVEEAREADGRRRRRAARWGASTTRR